jgi:hypothetical protein
MQGSIKFFQVKLWPSQSNMQGTTCLQVCTAYIYIYICVCVCVCTINQLMHYSDNLLVYSTAPHIEDQENGMSQNYKIPISKINIKRI